MPEKINAAQKRKIYATARNLGMDNDLLHAFVEARTGCKHISDLTKPQGIRIIEEMTAHIEGRPGMATRRELWKIDQLVEKLGWADNPKRLRAFLRKYYHVDDPRFLTHRDAWRVVESLKMLLKKAKGGADASERG